MKKSVKKKKPYVCPKLIKVKVSPLRKILIRSSSGCCGAGDGGGRSSPVALF